MPTTTASFKPEIKQIKTQFGKHHGYEAELFGFTGYGKTKNDALEDLHDRLSRARAPQGQQINLISIGNHRAFVWYDIDDGWSFTIRHEGDDRAVRSGSHSVGREAMWDTIERAKLHLAIAAYQPTVNTDSSQTFDAGIHLTNEHDRDFQQSAIEHNRYRYAQEILKYDDNDAHSFAGKNPARPDLWEGK